MLDFVIFYAGAHAAVMGVGLLLRGDLKKNWILGGMFFCLSAVFLGELLEHGNFFVDFPHLANLATPLIPLLGPLLYLYFRTLLDPDLRVPRRFYLHFLVTPLVAALLIPFYLLAGSDKVSYLAGDSQSSRVIGVHTYLTVVYTVMLLYMAMFLVVVLRHISFIWSRTALKNERINVVTLILVVVTVVALVAFIIGRLLNIEVFNEVGWLFCSLLLVGLQLVGQRYPRFIHKVQEEARKARYLKSRIRNLDTRLIVEKMETLLTKQQLFKDDDLTLPTLASYLKVTPHQLSEILNQKLNISFKNYINRYRLDAARQLLVAEPQRTILSIAHAVGFSSKSNFNRVFQQSYRESPTAYRTRQIADAASQQPGTSPDV